MTAPDRPTREQVDTALRWVDVNGPGSTRHLAAWWLAAEVRALRAECEQLRGRDDEPGTVAVQWAVQFANGQVDVDRDRNTERDARALAAAAPGATLIHRRTWHGMWTRGEPSSVAPLPAVPDGEVDETGRCDWCESEVPLTADGYMHAHKQPDDGADCAGSHDDSFGHLAHPGTVQDGEDVPARLDAAADALAESLLGMCNEAEQLLDRTPYLSTREVRAAVAAALARIPNLTEKD